MAFIPEAFVSKVVEQLNQEVRLVVGVKDEVKKLINNFQVIQAVLADADQKQLKDASIRLWLDDLKEISYEIDDVLDEWRSAMLMNSDDHPIDSSGHTTMILVLGQVCSFISSCFRFREIGLRHDIAHKIKDLCGKLDEIANRRNDYNLVSHVGGSARDERVTTISDINITEVQGRAEEKEKIINMLLSESSDAPVPQIISIVGMGGLGKTTLAQLAYNDVGVENHFKKRIWVCVSDPFDENQIAKAILESLGDSRGSELPTMQTMVQDIKSRIGGKKYLLVLDDVWNGAPNKWKNVKAALSCGLPGSKILVTTRNYGVAKIMSRIDSNILQPELLSEEECWTIIHNEVALSEREEQDLQRLEDIGRQIASKCKGLPLAAKAFGGLLRFRKSRQEWQSALDSEMWQLGEDEAEIKNDLFVPLWLSYRDLSPAARQCLSYCIFFPKDFEIEKYDLIKMWMAQGYLKETETTDMEMFAEEYFRNLSARSFFQNFEKNGDGQIVKFKMHDIVHDFVQFISKKECLYWEGFENKQVEVLAKSVHHLFVPDIKETPNFIVSFTKLRSLKVSFRLNLDLSSLLIDRLLNDSFRLDLDLPSLLKELTCLRSLILYGDITEIPSEIGGLIHLRLLDIRGGWGLSELPETIGDLCNLLVLNISVCPALKQLPRGIEKLSNLRYLVKEEINLTQEIGRLNALREAKFRVGSEACSLGNLKNLNHLNSVHIILGRNVEHVNGAKQAQLNKKNHLVSLRLEFEGAEAEAAAHRWELHDEEVIEALQPCSNLETLVIRGYLGTNPNPSWLLSLNHLRRLELNGWRNCNCLPPLGKLQFLTHLSVSGMKVKKMGLEFWGIDETFLSVEAFPKLEYLDIGGCGEWEECDMDDRGHFIIMPRLTTFSVIDCNNLKALPDLLLEMPRLTTFSVIDCNNLKALPDLLLEKTTLKSFTMNRCFDLAPRFVENGVDWPKIRHIPHLQINDIHYRRGGI